ncbi:uncharacterized protein with PQ loop repeat [Desulfohalotomaculum tongense]|uniref:hypothetical protein n=1 Tax=Desulforadius tongensis TaxID=1216062 RepID=UPI0019572BB8|nr:hypothetical protein [Desulforadius tongensis]MBM7855213.1 uncharacterized protein with PQ loop repeat [Desulforadius tongensis]
MYYLLELVENIKLDSSWLSPALKHGVSQAFLAALAASGISWLLNGRLFNIYNHKAVIYLGPAVEELSKTGLAVLVGAPVMLTHTLFGAVEALWELKTYRRGAAAGFAALATHAFYGWLAQMVIDHSGIPAALAVVYAVHMLWNFWVMHKLT